MTLREFGLVPRTPKSLAADSLVLVVSMMPPACGAEFGGVHA